MRIGYTRRIVFLLFLGAAAACSMKETPTTTYSGAGMYGTPGKNGKVGFVYGGLATSCSSLCSMMPGTTERLNFSPGLPLDAVFESSDETIVSIEKGGEEYEGTADGGLLSILGKHMKAVAPGTVEFRVKTSAGEIIDRIDLVVEVPARVALQATSADGGATETATANLRPGASIDLVAQAYRADGTPIEAQAGWTFSSDNPSVVSVTDACALICLVGDSTLQATALGAGTAHATAAGAGVTGSASITVTP
jgi:hypothetical protein